MPDMCLDPDVIKRKDYLVAEAKKMIEILTNTYSAISDDPLTDSVCLGKMVYDGYLDAPQLRGNPAALGKVKTMPVNGGYDIVDDSGKVISHAEYFSKYLKK